MMGTTTVGQGLLIELILKSFKEGKRAEMI